jgi:hypothetical protein
VGPGAVEPDSDSFPCRHSCGIELGARCKGGKLDVIGRAYRALFQQRAVNVDQTVKVRKAADLEKQVCVTSSPLPWLMMARAGG